DGIAFMRLPNKTSSYVRQRGKNYEEQPSEGNRTAVSSDMGAESGLKRRNRREGGDEN
ncbi:unnamed protein product, partial [Ilex paraguariensis]